MLHLNNRLLLSRRAGAAIRSRAGGAGGSGVRVGDKTPDYVNLRVARKSVPVRRDGNQLVFTVDAILDHEVDTPLPADRSHGQRASSDAPP